MQPFTRFAPRERIEPPQTNQPDPSVVPEPFNRTSMPTQSGALLSRGVSIKGSVKFLNELLIDGDVEGTIESTGTLTIGEHACIRGEIRTKSVVGKLLKAPGVEPVFPKKDQAIDYAQNRACFRSSEIRVLDCILSDAWHKLWPPGG